MPLEETLPLTPATAQWSVWSTTARIVLTDASYLEAAREIATRRLALVDTACSRFRADSELMTLPAGRPVQVSEQLAELVRAALDAARVTDGLVSPTVGSVLSRLGYDGDWSQLPADRPAREVRAVRVRQLPSWRQVRLDGRQLTVPLGVQLDLGATGKAFTADLIAAEIAAALPVGALVALGGDIATAGPQPTGGWNVLVQDRPGDPAITVRLAPQGAIATSSTQGRRWKSGGHQMHHIVDPRSCTPAKVVWRTATVAAPSCVQANTLSTAALILGLDAPNWLQQRGFAARLVATSGEVLTIAGFPESAENTEESRVS
jgi:thiamine biosynthesis lipoprotein